MDTVTLDLKSWQTELEKALTTLDTQQEPASFLRNLQRTTIRLTQRFQELAQQAATEWDQTELKTTPNEEVALMLFCWLERGKTLLLLWRDVYFELSKALLYQREGKVEKGSFAKLRERSITSLEEASAQFIPLTEKDRKELRQGKRNGQRQLEAWQLLESPWPVYDAQLNEIIAQSEQLAEQHQILQLEIDRFRQLRKLIEETVQRSREEMQADRTLAQETIRFIETHITDKPARIASHLEGLQQQDFNRQLNRAFNTQLHDLQEQLSRALKIVIATKHGVLQRRELNLQQSVQRWLESEIIPLLNEIWETDEFQHNSLKMAMANIRNRVLILTSEQQEEMPNLAREDVSQPLLSFLHKFVDWDQNQQEFFTLLDNRLQNEFWLTRIFATESRFLQVPLQSTIQQLRFNQDAWWSVIRRWSKRRLSSVERFRRNVALEEKLSVSEKIVRCIEQRTADRKNQQYTSIFLTRGYIGESFWVGREQEQQRFRKLVQQWRNGYRGAVLLSGTRLSGKSLFGEMMINRFFVDNIIRLQPNTSLSLAGRTIELTHDLHAALQFVRKYALQSKAVIWIDDLELWAEPDLPLGENVRQLIRHIDAVSNNLFFVVSTSNSNSRQLDYSLSWLKVFQAEINLDQMPLDNISEALLIRHGATHKHLVNEKGEQLTAAEIQRSIRRIYRAAHGNIGEALNDWAAYTRYYGPDKVIQAQSRYYGLPDLLHHDLAILLNVLLNEKRTNEYRLRKRFGEAFKDRYSSILQRLLSMGMVTRGLDGWLEANELIVNELGYLLESQQYLHYTSKN